MLIFVTGILAVICIEDVEDCIRNDLEKLVCDHTQRVFAHCTKEL